MKNPLKSWGRVGPSSILLELEFALVVWTDKVDEQDLHLDEQSDRQLVEL